jgi:hypothetical protein
VCQNLQAHSSGFESHLNLESLVTITSCRPRRAPLGAAPGQHVARATSRNASGSIIPGWCMNSSTSLPLGAASLRFVEVGELGQSGLHIGQLVKGDGTEWPRRRRGRHQLVCTRPLTVSHSSMGYRVTVSNGLANLLTWGAPGRCGLNFHPGVDNLFYQQ